MNIQELVECLELEYYSSLAANPHWDKTLVEFLQERGVSDDDIWEHCPGAAEDADLPIPEWY